MRINVFFFDENLNIDRSYIYADLFSSNEVILQSNLNDHNRSRWIECPSHTGKSISISLFPTERSFSK